MGFLSCGTERFIGSGFKIGVPLELAYFKTLCIGCLLFTKLLFYFIQSPEQNQDVHAEPGIVSLHSKCPNYTIFVTSSSLKLAAI
jgi:hypothetical protein